MAVFALGDFMWSLLVLFFMIIYFMMLLQVIVDVFRRRDASGWKKAGWLMFLLVAPVLGLITYMVTNSEPMAQRDAALLEARRRADGSMSDSGAAAEISSAKALLDSGAISPDEYVQIKSKVLA